ncbi:MAG: carbamoyltransferase C-terminal domain-containing protein, partial [Myxococcota bacterium]|nr:carbamoyltransferase C-terminal domain-containing protein [Myxococcota bacterium]
SLLEHVSPDHVLPYLKRGVSAEPGTQWKVQTFDKVEDLCKATADRLMNHEIVGWVQGGFEMGPRALGNRSILARPDDLDNAMRLSRKVKERAAYRPYAFSVTTEDALQVLDIAAEHVSSNRWMQLAVPVLDREKERVRATLHVDGTTRPQVCGEDQNPRYHALLRAFGERFGLSLLLNTSFNPSGYPLVASPVEALVMFARTDMDALVVENSLIWKDRASTKGAA